MTDYDLLQQYVQRQSNDAMCELVRRHIDMVHATALRELRDAHLAEDVTQAVFLVLLRRAGSLSARVIVGGWLFKTTMYAVANVRKGLARRAIHEREAGQMKTPDANSPPEHAAIVAALNEGISGLSTADRSVIVLRYLEGRSTQELATTLGIAEPAVRQRLSRAVGKLRRQLARRGVSAAAATVGVALESSKAHAVTTSLLAPVEAMMRGAVPAASVQTIVRGVLQMLRHTQVLMSAVVAGIACLIVGAGVMVATRANAQNAAPATVTSVAVTAAERPPTSGPAATRVASKFGPAATPKGTILAAFAAALAGDADGMISCLQNPTDEDKVPMRHFAAALSGYDRFSKAVEKQFGNAGLAQLNASRVMGGLNPTEIADATETIEGITAIVDIGKSGPGGGLPMVKVGDVWMIDSAILRRLNRPLIEAMAKVGPALGQIAENIETKKYANVQEALAAVQKELEAVQKGGAPEASPLP